MKTRLVISLIILGAFILLPQAVLADDLADLKATHKMEQKAFTTGDLETGFGYFHEGMVYISPNRGFPIVMNLARAKPHWIKWWETHAWRNRWYKVEYRVIGNTGLVWGVREVTVINKKSGSGSRRQSHFQLKIVEWHISSGSFLHKI
jgi:hypothetical protein